MSYEGIEVDMLNLGNADSILVSCWKNGKADRILIDGGNTSDSDKVLAFLKERSVSYLNHIVCSHPHDDHVGGLIGIVKSKDIDFGHAWIHLPWKHVDQTMLTTVLNRGEVTAKRVVKIIKESVQSSQDFVKVVTDRGKPVAEPFQGGHIGFLFVCGPSQQFYEQLLKDFTDLEKLKLMEASRIAYEKLNELEDLQEATAQLGKKDAEGLGQAPTEPENNSSTILWMTHPEGGLLFTADAGVEALTAVNQVYVNGLSNLRWMQIPHHGSRRNVNEELIKYFKPKEAFVSADGTKKHPRRAVVNAFKEADTKVYSTHYTLDGAGGNLWLPLGEVPLRSNYISATPLYEATKDKKTKLS
jgi:beta-lactamase superfamily II metal-dependent hydrolase